MVHTYFSTCFLATWQSPIPACPKCHDRLRSNPKCFDTQYKLLGSRKSVATSKACQPTLMKQNFVAGGSGAGATREGDLGCDSPLVQTGLVMSWQKPIRLSFTRYHLEDTCCECRRGLPYPPHGRPGREGWVRPVDRHLSGKPLTIRPVSRGPCG